MDHTDRGTGAALRDLLGSVMAGRASNAGRAAVLDVVALLADVPPEGLVRGQVGTVVEALNEHDVLVEFSDNDGAAYAILSCRRTDLLTLRTVPWAA